MDKFENSFHARPPNTVLSLNFEVYLNSVFDKYIGFMFPVHNNLTTRMTTFIETQKAAPNPTPDFPNPKLKLRDQV